MRNHYLKYLAFLFASFLFALEIAQAYQISVDGDRGRDGSRERDYRTSSGASSGRGSHGADATRSTPGQDAGRIEITLRDTAPTGAPSRVEVSGFKINAQGRRIDINENWSFGNGETLNLSAQGGRGGNGGHGGNGQGGCNGRDGRDAYKRTKAGDGTDGCNGGNGGDGTPGSNGGAGGQIVVNVSISDVHLLRSLDLSVNGGAGGDRGRNGDAGRGGYRGEGGRGDSWREQTGTRQESYTDYEYDQDCDLESNGDGSYSNVCRTVSRPVTRYRTVPVYTNFSTPAGRDGSPGRNGSSGSGNISAGSRGSNGNYVFNVIYPNGRREQYQRPFQLNITSYNVVEDEATRNGVFEPGEVIHLENITVTNSGGAPSPSGNANVITNLRSSSLQVINDRLNVPSLKRGERHRFSERLSLKIPENSHVGGVDAVELLHTIKPAAVVDKTRMRLREFGLEKAIHAKYPVVITFFQVPEVMAPGERLPMLVRLENISNQAIGSNRLLENEISFAGGETPHDNVTFGRVEGEEERSLTWVIERLGPKESVLLETFVSLADETPVYTSFHVETDLFLQRLGDQSNSSIQRRTLEIKVAQKYRYNEDAQLLLITNSRTTRDEYNAWMEFARSHAIKIDIWDLNYYGTFSLRQNLESGSTLMENYRNKTILFVNNGDPEGDRALRRLQAKDFLEATQDNNINFLFIGGDTEENQRLIDSYLAQTRSNSEQVESRIEQNGLARIFSTLRRRQQEAMEALNIRLLNENPNQRYIITRSGKNGLIARPALGISGGHAYALSFQDRELRSRSTILSQEMYRAILLPLSFNTKLDLLSGQFSNEVNDALIFDLIQEIDLADQGLERSDSVRIEFMTHYLSLLNRLQANQNRSHFDKLIAGILEYTQHLRTSFLKDRVKSDLEALENDRISELRTEIREEANNRKELLPGISERDNMRNMLTLPAVHRVQSTEQIQNENIILENQ